ncbi:MAG: methylisocitrate lyase [Gemmatales bacterium]|nr:methylisocitrate lyase [Gemmatales bacterium]MCS7161611.1 methylisocitrate lyase [Gemmatales bacterium]MDW8176814.1 methylisocitrate lyase [Gemmatales bacterium]MDW8221839.1 methylisocitrate lyase [Gemmatales bacterium]
MAHSDTRARLRQVLERSAIQMPGVLDAIQARLAERLGFSGLYLSGAGLSASLGLPDVGLITLTELVERARLICQTSTLPLLVDADTGFGEAVNVERTVRLLEATGVAGMHMEDQELPKRCGHLSGKRLVATEVMVQKIRAAVAAREDRHFLLIARTDARAVEGFESAIRRAQAYLAAGADGIFPEALESAEEMARFAQAVPSLLVANMTEFGRSPLLDFSTLAGMGYRIVLYPVTLARLAWKAVEAGLRELKVHGHQRGLLPHMLTRQELYDLLGYRDYEERDRYYFAATPEMSQHSKE